MNRLKFLRLMVCVTAVSVAAIGASAISTPAIGAQAGDAPAGDAPPGGAPAENVRDLVQAYRVWKLTDVLDLSEDQMPAFYAKLKEIDRLEADLLQEQRDVVRRLTDILDDKEIDQEKLNRALDEHRMLRLKRIEKVGRLRDEAEMMLSAEQRARYIVFDQEFRSDIRNIVQKARDLERQRRMDEQMDRWDSGMGSPGSRGGGGGTGGRGRR